MRLDARWPLSGANLRLWEPSIDELVLAAPLLAHFYNEPRNRELLGNTLTFTPVDVVHLWARAADVGARSFLFSRDDVVIGDADLRNHRRDAAEVALLLGPRELQGRGLGRRLLAMLLVIAFEEVGLSRLYASIRPDNAASLRLFARAGFVRDEGAVGRSFADEPDDVCVSLPRGSFLSRPPATEPEIEITPAR